MPQIRTTITHPTVSVQSAPGIQVTPPQGQPHLIRVASQSLSTPPADPNPGYAAIVWPDATDARAGQEKTIATRDQGNRTFITPYTGLVVYVEDGLDATGTAKGTRGRQRDGTAWVYRDVGIYVSPAVTDSLQTELQTKLSQGGDAFASPVMVGSNDSQDLNLVTDGQVRATVTAAGNLSLVSLSAGQLVGVDSTGYLADSGLTLEDVPHLTGAASNLQTQINGLSNLVTGAVRIRGTYSITDNPADYPTPLASDAVNAVQTGDGSCEGSTISAGDARYIQGEGGQIGPNGLAVGHDFLIIAVVDGATNDDTSRIVRPMQVVPSNVLPVFQYAPSLAQQGNSYNNRPDLYTAYAGVQGFKFIYFYEDCVLSDAGTYFFPDTIFRGNSTAIIAGDRVKVEIAWDFQIYDFPNQLQSLHLNFNTPSQYAVYIQTSKRVKLTDAEVSVTDETSPVLPTFYFPVGYTFELYDSVLMLPDTRTMQGCRYCAATMDIHLYGSSSVTFNGGRLGGVNLVVHNASVDIIRRVRQATLSQYSVGDILSIWANLYRCVTTHTAGRYFFQDLQEAKWAQISGVNLIPASAEKRPLRAMRESGQGWNDVATMNGGVLQVTIDSFLWQWSASNYPANGDSFVVSTDVVGDGTALTLAVNDMQAVPVFYQGFVDPIFGSQDIPVLSSNLVPGASFQVMRCGSLGCRMMAAGRPTPRIFSPSYSSGALTQSGTDILATNPSVDPTHDPRDTDTYILYVIDNTTPGGLQFQVNGGSLFPVMYTDNTQIQVQDLCVGETLVVEFDDRSTARRSTKTNTRPILVGAGTSTLDSSRDIVCMNSASTSTVLTIDPTLLVVGKKYTIQWIFGSFTASIAVSSGTIYGEGVVASSVNFVTHYQAITFYSDNTNIYLI